MRNHRRFLVLCLTFVLALTLLTGCSQPGDSGAESNKYPEVVRCINEARAKLGNGTVVENTVADVYADRLGAMYLERNASFGEIAKSYMSTTAVGWKEWKAWDCSISFNDKAEKYLTSYIATRKDITIVGVSVVQEGDLRYLVIVGY